MIQYQDRHCSIGDKLDFYQSGNHVIFIHTRSLNFVQNFKKVNGAVLKKDPKILIQGKKITQNSPEIPFFYAQKNFSETKFIIFFHFSILHFEK